MTGHGRIAVANARTVIPPRLGLSTELAVGLMLVLLGVLTLTGMSRGVGGGRAAQYAAMATTCIGIRMVTARTTTIMPVTRTPLALLDRSWLRGLPLYHCCGPLQSV